MAQKINRLTARSVAAITGSGRHADGGNLYLNVTPTGARSWVFLFKWHGKPVELGLGAERDVTLAQARAIAGEYRTMIASGSNPKHARRPSQPATFGECATAYVEVHASEWVPKHAAEWLTSLERHARPLFHLPVAAITVDDVAAVLRPVWSKKRETAARVRGRIETVLSAAKAAKHRTGPNPAIWKDNLEHMLAKAPSKSQQRHLEALPYEGVPAFMARIRATDTASALVLEFLILTAARKMEGVCARWSEIDLDARVWSVPPPSMKKGRPHSVPLSPAVLDLLERVRPLREGDYLFPSPARRDGLPLCHTALDYLMREKLKEPVATVHGFRSSFKDWCRSRGFADELSEIALAHLDKDRVRAAYARDPMIEARRPMMDAWALFCFGAGTGKVVSIRSRG